MLLSFDEIESLKKLTLSLLRKVTGRTKRIYRDQWSREEELPSFTKGQESGENR